MENFLIAGFSLMLTSCVAALILQARNRAIAVKQQVNSQSVAYQLAVILARKQDIISFYEAQAKAHQLPLYSDTQCSPGGSHAQGN